MFRPYLTSYDVVYATQEVLRDFPADVARSEPKKRVKRRMSNTGCEPIVCSLRIFMWYSREICLL